MWYIACFYPYLGDLSFLSLPSILILGWWCVMYDIELGVQCIISIHIHTRSVSSVWMTYAHLWLYFFVFWRPFYCMCPWQPPVKKIQGPSKPFKLRILKKDIMKSTTLSWVLIFLKRKYTNILQNLHQERCASYLFNDTKDVWFCRIYCRHWMHSNQSLFWCFA